MSDGEASETSDIFNGFFVVGDLHIRSKHLKEAGEFVDKCIAQIERMYPSAIVLLGDVLDTHEIAREEPFNLACEFIERCSKIAVTFVLIGNHDYINNTQQSTERHFFNPLKKWDNVYIVDKPMKFSIQGITAVMCPYAPKGKFFESILSAFNGNRRWNEGVDVVFAHQEFRGVSLRRDVNTRRLLDPSDSKDIYGGLLPPVISGHIHHAQTIEPNIYYPGSAMQIHFDEDPDKYVWLVNIDEEDSRELVIEKFDLNLKNLQEIRMHVNNAEYFDTDLLEKYYVKLRLSGTTELFQVFRKKAVYKSLIQKGVKIVFEPDSSNAVSREMSQSVKHLSSFIDIMKELVNQSSDGVKQEFENLVRSGGENDDNMDDDGEKEEEDGYENDD